MTINQSDIMKAFYASLQSSSEITSPSYISYRPSDKTKKAIHILQDLLSKDFSLLLHPGRSILMKDTLRYLLTLQLDEGFSLATNTEIQQCLRCFVQWSLEYHNAGLSATAELSKASEVKNDLEANVKEFQVLDKEEKFLCNQLVCLQEEKRKLEEKIRIINVQMESSTNRIDRIYKRKTELFDIGKGLEHEWNNKRLHVPRLKAEQELANKTRDNIESEWIKLRQQFMLVVARLTGSSMLSAAPSSSGVDQASTTIHAGCR